MADIEGGEGRKHRTVQDVWGDESWTASNFPGSKPIYGPNGELLEEPAPQAEPVAIDEVKEDLAKTAKKSLDWMG